MIGGWILWLLLVSVALVGVSAWVLLVRLPREEDDVSDSERPAEAAWIAGTIERHGGVAPASFVEEVLELHQAYLRTPRPPRPAGPPPMPPAAPPPLDYLRPPGPPPAPPR